MHVFEYLEPVRPFMAAGGGEDYAASQVALFGVPMDFTATFRPGSRMAPARIRDVSYALEEFSLEAGRDLDDVSFCDLGNVTLSFGRVEHSLNRVEELARKIACDGKVPVALGGEHLVSLPLVRALAERHPGLAVIQFDAHADLRYDYLGAEFSHATVMRRIHEILGEGELYQVGIRSATREEREFAAAHTHFLPQLPGRDPLQELADLVRTRLAGKKVYVTIDIDILDPAFAPGTGVPEPGGWTSSTLLQALYGLRGLEIVGLDLVEVSPPQDPADITALVAAKLVREALVTFW